jgi:hypothetical protein
MPSCTGGNARNIRFWSEGSIKRAAAEAGAGQVGLDGVEDREQRAARVAVVRRDLLPIAAPMVAASRRR